jgi:hypothetical protein
VERGDLLFLDGVKTLVVRVDEEGQATLSNPEGILSTVSLSLDETEPARCQILCNPTRDWPFVQIPPKKLGRVQQVVLPNLSTDHQTLTPFEDWIVGEPLRGGGALYLRPTLGLRFMDRIVIFCERGQTSLIVPKLFLAVGLKTDAAKFSRVDTNPKPTTVYDHLLGHGLGDDEDET